MFSPLQHTVGIHPKPMTTSRPLNSLSPLPTSSFHTCIPLAAQYYSGLRFKCQLQKESYLVQIRLTSSSISLRYHHLGLLHKSSPSTCVQQPLPPEPYSIFLSALTLALFILSAVLLFQSVSQRSLAVWLGTGKVSVLFRALQWNSING